MNKFPQLPNTIIIICIQNTRENMAYLQFKHCPESFFIFFISVFDIIVLSIFYCSTLNDCRGCKSKLPNTPTPKYNIDNHFIQFGTYSAISLNDGSI